MNRNSEGYQEAVELGFDEEFELAFWARVKAEGKPVLIQEDPWQASVAHLPKEDEPF